MNEQFLIAVIASGSALLGSAIGQLGQVVQHWLSTRHERRVVLRQKYEQMATLVGELTVHIVASADPEAAPPALDPQSLDSRLATLRSLVLLYFPELGAPIEALAKDTVAFHSALRNSTYADLQGTSANFGNSRRVANEAIRTFASKYT